MDRAPRISVVLSVYNDAARLAASIDSVLAQEFTEFELIIVNDGSTDLRTLQILDEYSRKDARIRVIHKKNEGLTRGLRVGCAAAGGVYIGRMDCGDRYLAAKLTTQIAVLDEHPEVVLVSCGTRYVYSDGTLLREDVVDDDPAEATRKLRAESLSLFRGICHHGTAVFRRADYERVGGYRTEFYFAQDIDLWLRLTDHGLVAFLPGIFYEAELAAEGISGVNSVAQRKLCAIAIRLRQVREKKLPEDGLLEKARQIGPLDRSTGWAARRCRASGHYFLGNLLFYQGHPASQRHLAFAVAENPIHIKAWILLACLLSPRFRP